MKRFIGLALGGAALAAAVMAAEPAEKSGDVARRVQVVRTFGGSYLGVVLEETKADERGARVSDVRPDTPAAKAGLKEGDVIVRFDGEGVRSVAQLTRLVRETPAGRTVPIEVSRGGAVQKLQATLDEAKGNRFFEGELPDLRGLGALLPPEAPEAPAPPMPPAVPAFRWHGHGPHGLAFDMLGGPRKLGIRFQEVSGQLAKYFKLASERGVLVADVDADGPAAKAGMKAGDLILKFDGKAIEGADDFRDAVADADAGKEVTITVQRDGRPLDLRATLAGERERPSGEST